jgi:hypothetical protein
MHGSSRISSLALASVLDSRVAMALRTFVVWHRSSGRLGIDRRGVLPRNPPSRRHDRVPSPYRSLSCSSIATSMGWLTARTLVQTSWAFARATRGPTAVLRIAMATESPMRRTPAPTNPAHRTPSFDVLRATPQHTYHILTKRVDRLESWTQKARWLAEEKRI